MERTVKTILDGVLEGRRVEIEEGLLLYTQADPDDLIRTAKRLREERCGAGRATYIVDRNVNYTNVCITDCKFCEFYRPKGHREAYVLPRADLYRKMDELRDAGGTRVLLQGGHHPDLPIEFYEELLGDLRERYPEIARDAFSPPEIEHISILSGLPIPRVVERLQAAGLSGIPGGGGEILDDEIRAIVSPKKTRTGPWLEVMEAGHRLGLYTSASQVIGFGEEPVHRIRALDRLRNQQDRSLGLYGLGFMAFISWPLQHESRYGRVFEKLKGWKLGATPAGYLRHAAFCRIYLDNFVHHQASWPTMGLEVAKEALSAGCDDMGGTMMEENVVSRAGSTQTCVTEARMRQAIAEAGYAPRKRDSWYRLAPETDAGVCAGA